jgi:YD repeat-containing protein
VNYSYVDDQPSAMTMTISGVTSNVVTGLTYAPFNGPIEGWTYGNGLTRSKTYDLNYRLSALATKNGATALQNLSYAFNANDLITSFTNSADATKNQSFGYDELSRVNSATANSGTTAYGYDANGNRLTQSGGVTFTISPTSNWMTASNALGATTFGHDAAGNTTTYAVSGTTGFLYSYDPFNRMSSFTQGATTFGSYVYNGKGERVAKAVSSGTPVRFTFGEDQRLLAERQDGTNVWTKYLWFGNELVGLVRANVPTYLHTDQAERPELDTNVSRVAVWKSVNAAVETQEITLDDIGGLNLGFPRCNRMGQA